MNATEKRVPALSELFDVFIINLAKDTARKDSAVSEVSAVGFKASVVEAEDSSQSIHLRNEFLRSGASACFASHVAAWKLASSSSKPYTIIMEDDIRIHDKESFLAALDAVAKTPLEIVQLGFLTTGFRQFVDIKLQNFEVSLLRFASSLSGDLFIHRLRVHRNSSVPKAFIADDFRPGAHCYILKSDVAMRLLSQKFPRTITLDAYLMALSWHQAFNTARVRTSLVGQKDFPSRIKSS